MSRRIALVRCDDTTDMNFEGYYFPILGWEDGYLKIEDIYDGDDRYLLPECDEGQAPKKFDSDYALLRFIRAGR